LACASCQRFCLTLILASRYHSNASRGLIRNALSQIAEALAKSPSAKAASTLASKVEAGVAGCTGTGCEDGGKFVGLELTSVTAEVTDSNIGGNVNSFEALISGVIVSLIGGAESGMLVQDANITTANNIKNFTGQSL
jgi:hypothetical protein